MTERTTIEKDDGDRFSGSPAGHDWVAYVVLALAILFMAGNNIAGRAVRDVAPPAGLTFWRCVVAVAIALPVMVFFMRSQAALLLVQWRRFLVLGFVWGVGGHFMVVTGLQTTTAINAGLIAATQPALAFLGAWVDPR